MFFLESSCFPGHSVLWRLTCKQDSIPSSCHQSFVVLHLSTPAPSPGWLAEGTPFCSVTHPVRTSPTLTTRPPDPFISLSEEGQACRRVLRRSPDHPCWRFQPHAVPEPFRCGEPGMWSRKSLQGFQPLLRQAPSFSHHLGLHVLHPLCFFWSTCPKESCSSLFICSQFL